MKLKKASSFGRGGGVADGEGKTALSPATAGALPGGRALCDAQLYGCEIHVISAIVIPRKCYFSAEAPAVQLGTRFSFRENFHPHTTIFLYRGKVTLWSR